MKYGFQSDLDLAIRQYNNEVDKIAADLIRNQGMAPWIAISEARKIVEAKRSGKKYVIPLT